jgi:hypothetical protein
VSNRCKQTRARVESQHAADAHPQDMADNQKYTAEEKARHAARVKEREARKKERQKQKKALTKHAAPAPQATNGGHKTYDASLLKRARNVGGPPYEAFLKYLPHDCADAASVSERFRTSTTPRRGRTRVHASREGCRSTQARSSR